MEYIAINTIKYNFEDVKEECQQKRNDDDEDADDDEYTNIDEDTDDEYDNRSSWAFDVFDDMDIVTYLYSDLAALEPDDTYHFDNWFK